MDRLCAVAASTGGQHSPIRAMEKLEGGFSKVLLFSKEDGSEIVAKIPFPIAGPPKYTTASEVAVLQYRKTAKSIRLLLCLRLMVSLSAVHRYTQVPVPKILAWNSDPSNPVGAEYIIMQKAPGIQLFKRWDEMSDWDQLCVVKQLTKLEGEMAKIRFPANGSLYLCESMAGDDTHTALDRDVDPSGKFCIGPSCERGWYAKGETTSQSSRFNRGPCEYTLISAKDLPS